ncbi:hypothetical protein B0J18DRAFT_217248 [Chaetomium sp. MPI-SDFR-AT-0129]|nr:hypothetical protein B0J18DRAFT_217248 [Chaetomium sp. MPI-SDFR-AT-0129]
MALPISSSQRSGHIVSLEGPSELVSTQLRLLPTSRHILVLPPLQHYLVDTIHGDHQDHQNHAGHSKTAFSPRELIHQYHAAYQARHAEALDFLRPTSLPTYTTEEPVTKLVLLHGGALSARLTCLSAIMEHEPGTQVEEAHATFLRLASIGSAGSVGYPTMTLPYIEPLSPLNAEDKDRPQDRDRNQDQNLHPHYASQDRITEQPTTNDVSSFRNSWGRGNTMAVREDESIQSRARIRSSINDRIIRAMRAAEALDKETEFLQPRTPDVELTVKLVDIPPPSSRRRPSQPFAVGSPPASETSRRSSRSRTSSRRGSQTSPTQTIWHSAHTTPRASQDSSSSASGTAHSSPSGSRRPSLKLHIPSSSVPWAGDVAAGGGLPVVYEARGQAAPSVIHRRSRTVESNISPTQGPVRGRGSEEGETTATTTTTTTMTGATVPLAQIGPLPEEEETGNDEAAHPTEAKPPISSTRSPFGSVLPLLEDLVVFFTPETPDDLHNFVFNRLNDGSRRPSVPGSWESDFDSFQIRSRSRSRVQDVQEGEQGEQGELGRAADGQSESDGNSSGNGHSKSSSTAMTPWARKDLVHGLPTPNHSPYPPNSSSSSIRSISSSETRLYSISVDQETALSIQNFLRSFLGSQFPLADRRFSAASGIEVPSNGEGGLWRPLDVEGKQKQVAAGAAPQEEGDERRLDLIMAVGSESGVTKTRLAEVMGQIEKLGFKSSGLSRSGRLDIRYLIANAMQAFTAQPLTKQVHSNPFADRALLAALIIPHLETYLAAHPDVRLLLLEYPPEHLPTVLALQTLIGSELMRVVGIINNDESAPAQQSLAIPQPSRRPSEGFRSLNNSRNGSLRPGAFSGPCSFSNANFLLTSSATGFETASFVAAVRENLISISDYYIPECPAYEAPVPQAVGNEAEGIPSTRSQSPPRDSSQETSPRPSTPPQKQKEASHMPTSTLVITPPTSPTASSVYSQSSISTKPVDKPPQAAQPVLATPAPQLGFPPRSSSVSVTSPPSWGRIIHPLRCESLPAKGRVQWGEINYTPLSPPPAPQPQPQEQQQQQQQPTPAVLTPPAEIVDEITATGGILAGTPPAAAVDAPIVTKVTNIQLHRHQASEQLSPRAIPRVVPQPMYQPPPPPVPLSIPQVEPLAQLQSTKPAAIPNVPAPANTSTASSALATGTTIAVSSPVKVASRNGSISHTSNLSNLSNPFSDEHAAPEQPLLPLQQPQPQQQQSQQPLRPHQQTAEVEEIVDEKAAVFNDDVYAFEFANTQNFDLTPTAIDIGPLGSGLPNSATTTLTNSSSTTTLVNPKPTHNIIPPNTASTTATNTNNPFTLTPHTAHLHSNTGSANNAAAGGFDDNFVDEDYLDDDDEDDEEEMRRLMPLFMKTRAEIERGRSSKAMKWLGLA